MSIQTIVRRCDHEACAATYDQTVYGSDAGWSRLITDVFPGRLRMDLDYCPDHRDAHGPTDEEIELSAALDAIRSGRVPS